MVVSNKRTYTLLLGNPGSGKSSLGNGLLGKTEFQSGVHYGSGLTTAVQLAHLPDGNVIGDAPGLDDARIRDKAAEEITKLLKSGEGEYKILFVVTLEAGRVRAVDVTTMTLILDAIAKSTTKLRYGIIINKLSNRTYRDLTDPNSDAAKSIMASVNSGLYKTPFICLYKRIEELEDEPNALHEPSQELKDFLALLPSVYLEPGMVADVKTTEFEKIKEGLMKEITKMREDNAALDRKLAEMKGELSQARLEVEEAAKEAIKARERADREIAESRREAGAAQQRAAEAYERFTETLGSQLDSLRQEAEQARRESEEVRNSAEEMRRQNEEMRRQNEQLAEKLNQAEAPLCVIS